MGIFVSMGGFTRDTEEKVCTQWRWRSTLINLEQMVDLWIEHYQKIEEPDNHLLSCETHLLPPALGVHRGGAVDG